MQNYFAIVLLYVLGVISLDGFSQNPWQRLREKPSVLALDEPVIKLETPSFYLDLVASSQTVAALRPRAVPDFDVTPGDSLRVRSGNGLYHLGDINLRYKLQGQKGWQTISTATERQQVQALPVRGNVLAAADLGPTLPADIPLQINRFWEMQQELLVLKFVIANKADKPVEIGAAGFPMIFNNILSGTLDQAHANNVFYDPYIGMDAGYLQVTRLTGQSPTLLVLPFGQTPFEAYRPLLDDPTPRGIIFEGFYEWMTCSKAYAEEEWKEAEPWNLPSSRTILPGEEVVFGFRFVLSGKPADIENSLIAQKRPVAVGVPGYVLPADVEAKLFLNYPVKVASIESVPRGAIHIERAKAKAGTSWQAFTLKGAGQGRSNIIITYQDGLRQTIQYKVIKPEREVIENYGNFLMTKQWFEADADTFHRSPSVISYDNEKKQQVLQESRAWIAGLSDEAGAGSWLGAFMKQYLVPDNTQIQKLDKFLDRTLWGGIQVAAGPQKWGVRKSLFYYEPDMMPAGTYSSGINYKSWSAWPLKEAYSVGRSYNYPHVTAAWWVMYRKARNFSGLVTSHPWQYYLTNACETALAMVRLAPYYAQFGQMEGTIFYLVLKDLQAEGMTELAASLESEMKKRAIHWSSLKYPFGSEMPWDSTGQEEVYIWSQYFGFGEKADITLNAILGYMPSIPGWGYNGNARRYWDFLYAGKLTRIERMLHHYGSALNAIPVLDAYRRNPGNFYLLKVGYGGYLGSIANVEEDGFAPAAFHAYPSTLRNDGYSGDYGSGFFGHAINSASYLVNHPEFGWLAFGGNLSVNKKKISVMPLTASRAAVYLAPEGLWIKFEAGSIRSLTYEIPNGDIIIKLDKAGPFNPAAYLSVETFGAAGKQSAYIIKNKADAHLDRFRVALADHETTIILTKKP